MKTPNCSTCNDTGSTSKHMTGHLDCISCSAATDRVMLEAFIEDLPAMGERDKAWVIHQRALAMAPKQETDHINDVVKMVAPAGWKLVPEDPTGDMFRAAAKIDNEMFAGGSSHGAEDGQVWAAMYDAAPEAPIAAPAAANGAPDDQPLIGKLMDKMCFLPVLWGLNEPGALLRHSDVFRMLVDASYEQAALAANSGSKNSSSCPAAADVDSLDAALQRAAGELPDGYTIRVEVERGAGWVEWSGGDAEGAIDHDGLLADEVLQALADAKEHAAAGGSAA